MFWGKQKKGTPQKDDHALVRQDPRIRVETTTASSHTTNSSVQNATIFNSNTNTVTYKTTHETVTHTQKARITEIVSRRTPSQSELEEMFRTMNMNKGGESYQRRSGNFGSTTGQHRTGSFLNNQNSGISAKSATKFKKSVDTTASPVKRITIKYDTTRDNNKSNRSSSELSPTTPKTPTMVKIQEVTFSQKTGGSITSKSEIYRFKLNTDKSNSTSSTSYQRTDARPLFELQDPTALTTYTSPYTKPAQYSASQTKTSYIPAYTSSAYNSLLNKPATTKTTTLTTTSTTPSTTTKFSFFPNSLNPLKTTTATTASTVSKPIKPIVPLKTGKKSNLNPGCAYIFNNDRFDDPKNETRIGSAKDVKSLVQTFELFKLKVEVIENATLDKLRKIIHKIQTKDFTKISCIVIVVMSHGNRYEEVAAKDGNYSIDDDILFPILCNKTLTDKPKLLFIQACKGAMEAGGFKKDAVMPHGTPSEILKCYSTFEGYVSYRSVEGSMFIQTLCESLQVFGGIKNIKEIMETVTLLVKKNSENRQIPTMTSNLTKPYVFGDYV